MTKIIKSLLLGIVLFSIFQVVPFSSATTVFQEESTLKQVEGLVQYTNGDINSIYFPQRAEYTLLSEIEGKELLFKSTSNEIYINKDWLKRHGITTPLILAPGFHITETDTHYILSNGNGGLIRIVNINVKTHSTGAEISWETNSIDGGDQYIPQVENGYVKYSISSLTNQITASKTCENGYLCSFVAKIENLHSSTTYTYQLFVNYKFTFPNGTIGQGTATVSGSFVTRENTPPDPPQPLSPPNGTYLSPGTVTFKWDGKDPDGNKLTYHIKIGLNGAIPSEYATTGDTQMTITFNSPGTYYWQVVAEDPQGARSESEIRFFTITSNSEGNQPPNKPSMLVPSDGKILIADGDPTEVLLRWKCDDPDGDTLSYKVYMGASPDELKYLTTTALPQLSVRLKPGTYYWKIIAQDSKGAYKSSDINNFVIIQNENITLRFYLLRARHLRPGLLTKPNMYVKLTVNGETYKSTTLSNNGDIEKSSLLEVTCYPISKHKASLL